MAPPSSLPVPLVLPPMVAGLSTDVTVMATVSVSDSGVPALSVDSTVRVSLPLKLRLPW